MLPPRINLRIPSPPHPKDACIRLEKRSKSSAWRSCPNVQISTRIPFDCFLRGVGFAPGFRSLFFWPEKERPDLLFQAFFFPSVLWPNSQYSGKSFSTSWYRPFPLLSPFFSNRVRTSSAKTKSGIKKEGKKEKDRETFTLTFQPESTYVNSATKKLSWFLTGFKTAN